MLNRAWYYQASDEENFLRRSEFNLWGAVLMQAVLDYLGLGLGKCTSADYPAEDWIFERGGAFAHICSYLNMPPDRIRKALRERPDEIREYIKRQMREEKRGTGGQVWRHLKSKMDSFK
jgi:hypothetical protein